MTRSVRRRLAGAAGVVAALSALTGCTLTAAEQEENRQVAVAIAQLDPADYGNAPGGKDINCADVPWLGNALADKSVRCWSMDLGDGEARDTAVAVATDLATASGGQMTGVTCGEAGGAEVQCASFASIPEARDANVEIWVALGDDAVEQLEPGASAGEYFVTFRLVAYGVDFYETGPAVTPTPSP